MCMTMAGLTARFIPIALHKTVPICSAASALLNQSFFTRPTQYAPAPKFSTPIPEFENVSGIRSYQDLYKFSIQNSDEFWDKLAHSWLEWSTDFAKVQECDISQGTIKWFSKGKLNVSVNCVDRHFIKNPDKVAIIWEKDEPGNQEYITYKQLYELVNRFSNVLKSHGVQRGDCVVVYMPVSPLAVAAMLACTRIGALHNVVFAGFSSDALATRIQDAGAETVITTDQGLRGGKVIELKRTVDGALAKCPCVKRLFIAKRTGAEVPKGRLDIDLEQELLKQPSTCEPEIMNSEDLLFVLYTSGSTGKPKGLAHSQAGYLLYAAVTQKFVFDYKEGDVFGCMADIGWITGHSYVVYGPLCNGATTVLFESVPTYPDPGRYWETVERLRINQFYCAPTAIRLLLRYDDSWVKKYDKSSLRTLGCVGEPLNVEAWEWYYHNVGNSRCPVVDTWWQTETGGICITPRPSAPNDEIQPGMPMRPFFGIQPAIVDEKGREVDEAGYHGALCMKKPWPGMALTVYKDHERYLDTYYRPYPGFYFTGDGAFRHDDGYIQITGRMDDVINISGHRIGTAEIEDAMDTHHDVSETAVVGFPHDIKGEGVYAFITLKEHVELSELQIKEDLKLLVKTHIAAFAIPDIIQISPGLPKTRSGKIMRRVLRKIAANKSDELGDISTLAEPSVVDEIIEKHNLQMKE